MGISERTGKELKKQDVSAIRSHCQQQKHNFIQDSFSIIGRENDEVSLRLMESIMIKLQKPELNVMINDLNLKTM